MVKLKTLSSNINIIDTRIVKPAATAAAPARAGTTERSQMKRRIFMRDGGRCCMCNRVVDYSTSHADHRIALQFCYGQGMTAAQANSARNLWTLCIDCHEQKSIREMNSNEPDILALNYPAPEDIINDELKFI